MTDTAAPTPIASVAFVQPTESLLASRRPDVMRVRTVYRGEDEAIVYIGYPEDTGTDERRPALVRSLAKLVADAASVDLKEPSHFPDARTLPVQVQVFAPEPELSGPSAEVLLDHRGAKPWDMEIVFDGLNYSRDAAHWIVDVLVSAANHLEASTTAQTVAGD
ncbi:hypothetical protein RF644_17655 [Kocuria sp. CPCC 205258]|uniref:hypothetical protein n=1 Tax=Kocuria sp. CPCC 205258 TaxID=3073552 RepID=UPI0034D577C7